MKAFSVWSYRLPEGMLSNEEPARLMTQKTALRSIRPKDVMTSRFSLLTSHRGKVLHGFGKRKHIGILWNFHRKN
jgi:hypothetical protein